jgi:hypothetical protein
VADEGYKVRTIPPVPDDGPRLREKLLCTSDPSALSLVSLFSFSASRVLGGLSVFCSLHFHLVAFSSAARSLPPSKLPSAFRPALIRSPASPVLTPGRFGFGPRLGLTSLSRPPNWGLQFPFDHPSSPHPDSGTPVEPAAAEPRKTPTYRTTLGSLLLPRRHPAPDKHGRAEFLPARLEDDQVDHIHAAVELQLLPRPESLVRLGLSALQAQGLSILHRQGFLRGRQSVGGRERKKRRTLPRTGAVVRPR